MIYITGNTHREFGRIFDFCEENGTTKDDVRIILGDAEINYYLDISDYNLKWQLSALEVTLLCVHGNHEERPFLINGYEEKRGAAASSTARRNSPTSCLPRMGRSTI